MIPRKPLGGSGLTLSVLGLGTWPFAEGYDWGNTGASDISSVVSAAHEAGINWLDTAPVYEGCEEKLGRVLSGRRSQFLLATKCGLIKKGSWSVHDVSPVVLRAQLENSLRALQTDYIDLYQLHYPVVSTPLAEVLETLFRFQQEGKVRAVGVCNVAGADLQHLSVLPACVQNEFSLLHPQKGKSVWNFCTEKELGFIGYGTLCGGLLSGKYTREPNLRRADARNYFYRCYRGNSFIQAQKYAERVVQLAKRLEVKPAAVAVAWALSFAPVTAVLCGAKTAGQLTENACGARLILTPEELAFLESK